MGLNVGWRVVPIRSTTTPAVSNRCRAATARRRTCRRMVLSANTLAGEGQGYQVVRYVLRVAALGRVRLPFAGQDGPLVVRRVDRLIAGPRPSTSSETGGSVPEATGSPRRWG